MSWLREYVEMTYLVHQDTKVIPEECTGDTELPGAAEDESLSKDGQDGWNDDIEWRWEKVHSWLVLQRHGITRRKWKVQAKVRAIE